MAQKKTIMWNENGDKIANFNVLSKLILDRICHDLDKILRIFFLFNINNINSIIIVLCAVCHQAFLYSILTRLP